MKNKKGFTLIELLVVVAIIGRSTHTVASVGAQFR
jgi:prepilin-type N-terminal cleavage/methylation domain-containing protein